LFCLLCRTKPDPLQLRRFELLSDNSHYDLNVTRIPFRHSCLFKLYSMSRIWTYVDFRQRVYNPIPLATQSSCLYIYIYRYGSKRIRTFGALKKHNGLASQRFKPLGHTSNEYILLHCTFCSALPARAQANKKNIN
jgi:hypothetical protein